MEQHLKLIIIMKGMIEMKEYKEYDLSEKEYKLLKRK